VPFFYANAGTSHVFSANPNFDMWILLLRTWAPSLVSNCFQYLFSGA
jgi:hypothetical protein